MKNFIAKWQSAILIIPLISAILIYGSYKTIYGILTYDTFPFMIGSMLTIKILAVFNAILIPVIVASVYKLPINVAVTIWGTCVALGLLLDEGNYEGNTNMALATHLFYYQFLAIVLTMYWVVVQKKRTKKV